MTAVRAGSGIGAGAALAIAGLVLALALAFAAAAPGTAEARCKASGQPTDEISKQAARKAVRCLVNKERKARDLKLRGDLSRAAQRHTNYMRKHNCFAHVCLGEADLLKRIKRTGYLDGARSYTYGEVIVKMPQQATPRDAMRLWMNSPGHRILLLSSAYRHIGVGVSAKNGTALYTADLGNRS